MATVIIKLAGIIRMNNRIRYSVQHELLEQQSKVYRLVRAWRFIHAFGQQRYSILGRVTSSSWDANRFLATQTQVVCGEEISTWVISIPPTWNRAKRFVSKQVVDYLDKLSEWVFFHTYCKMRHLIQVYRPSTRCFALNKCVRIINGTILSY